MTGRGRAPGLGRGPGPGDIRSGKPHFPTEEAGYYPGYPALIRQRSTKNRHELLDFMVVSRRNKISPFSSVWTADLFTDGLWHMELKRRPVLGGVIRDGRHTTGQIPFSDGDPCTKGGGFPHAGDEIAKTGVEIGFPGAFSHRRKKGLNRPNWTADRFFDGLWHRKMKRTPVFQGEMRECPVTPPHTASAVTDPP